MPGRALAGGAGLKSVRSVQNCQGTNMHGIQIHPRLGFAGYSESVWLLGKTSGWENAFSSSCENEVKVHIVQLPRLGSLLFAAPSDPHDGLRDSLR